MIDKIPPNIPPDIWTFILVMAISTISGVISITHRIVQGRTFKVAWFISEFLAAILCGWLAYDTYYHLYGTLPEWVTMPVFVAMASHAGGRLLQGSEYFMSNRMSHINPNDKDRRSK